MIRAVAHLVLAAAAGALMACIPGCATPDAPPVEGRKVAVRDAPPPKADAPRPPAPPRGFVTMTVLGVLPVGGAHAVLLVDGPKQVVLPIVVGETEALSIELRLHHKRFTRPLTHDLLDQVVTDLGAKVLEVRVSGVGGGAFVGSLLLTQAHRVLTLDARPSDAIALAVGDGAPIYVAREVLDEAGIDRRALDHLTPDEVPRRRRRGRPGAGRGSLHRRPGRGGGAGLPRPHLRRHRPGTRPPRRRPRALVGLLRWPAPPAPSSPGRSTTSPTPPSPPR